MIYFKSPKNGQVFAYESQEDREFYGAPDLIPMTEDEVYAHENPAPTLYIPNSVTRFQALAALHLAGYLDDVRELMEDPETPILSKLAFDNALSFERTSPLLSHLAGKLGLSDADLDDLFVSAAGIEA